MDLDYGDALFGAVIALLLAEGCAWAPRLTGRIVRLAARRLSSDLRERLEEEWLRYVEDMPGTFGPFLAACQCLLASLRILPIQISFSGRNRAHRTRSFRDTLVKAFAPRRVQLQGKNVRYLLLVQRLRWISLIAAAIAVSFGSLVSAIEALISLAS